jgi:hypothetical protein
MSGACIAADVVLYDSSGNAAVTLDTHGQLWNYEGKVIGAIKGMPTGPAAVFSPDGKQIGWFKSGALHGLDGRAIWAVAGRHMQITEIAPVPPIKQVAPIAPIAGPVGVAPILSNEFGSTLGKALPEFTPPIPQASAPVQPQFTPSTGGQELTRNVLDAAQGLMALQEREQGRRASAEAHARDMARGAAEIAAMDREIERRRREVQIQEAQVQESDKEQERLAAYYAAQSRWAKQKIRNMETVYAQPIGPIVALESIPELGLKKGDVLRTDGPQDDGTTECTIQDFSLEGYICRRGDLSWSAGITRSVQPLEIIAERLREGKLRKLSEADFSEFVREHGDRSMQALQAFRGMLVRRFFDASETLPQLSVAKGEVIFFVKVELDGVYFQKVESGRDYVDLPAVEMATVLDWLERKQISAREL